MLHGQLARLPAISSVQQQLPSSCTCAGEVAIWRFVGPAAWDPGGSQKPAAELVRLRFCSTTSPALTSSYMPLLGSSV